MDDDGSLRCPVCNENRYDQSHNSTVNHRFQFMKWSYNNYRKALLNDRHGIELKVEPKKINNFHYDFRNIKGKYVMKVTPEQLQLHSCSITFKCKIRNTTKDPIYVTSTNLLHPSHHFKIVNSISFGDDESTFLKVHSGETYPFEISFTTDVLSYASHKIPLFCTFQTVDNKYSFTIVRTFLTIIADNITTKEAKTKSPFTSQPWQGIHTTNAATKSTRYTENYPIPGKFWKILSHGLQDFEGINSTDQEKLTEIRHCLERLTPQNYSNYWHYVLWLEEQGQSLMLKKYNMENVTMTMETDEILLLEVPGLAEKRPSVIAGDFIRIRLTGDHTIYEGFVCKVNNETVEISHVDEELLDLLRRYPNDAMDVSFVLGRLAFERSHRAVDLVVGSGMVAKLFPHGQISVRSYTAFQIQKYFNVSVRDNLDQKTAVNKILNMTHDFPYIIFGPPGTGKTVTIVEAILQIKQHTKKNILVCAPANSACDMLALKLKEHCSSEELIRIHSSTRDKTSIPEELKDYSNIEDDEFMKIGANALKSYRIVVSTLVLVGRFTGAYHPDCVFIDEAAQASEPETAISIALLTVGKQVVLAGDPKQLGPMATKSAEKFGLGISLLQRLMDCDIYKLNRRTGKYDSDFITMLRMNFRSHPDILSIPNRLFYNNLLQPVSSAAQRDPIVNIAIYPTIRNISKQIKGSAIEFCSVSSKEKREGSSPSYFNLFEVALVVDYVQAFHNCNLPEAYKVREDQIGVVTPYKRQVYKIKEALKHKGFADVEVGTTESFQGREKRIIIISTVRAQHALLLHDRKYNLGFVKHDQRFNVAVTRAISKLVVIGCPTVLRTDVKWTEFMELCNEFGSHFGNQVMVDNEHFRKEVIQRTRKFIYEDDQYKRR